MNMVKGSIRTEGRGRGSLSSVPGKVWGGLTNREMGEGRITMGQGEGGRVGGEGHSVVVWGGARGTMGKGGHIGALDVGGTRVVGDGIGSTSS